jgi:hypothetical protein
VQYLISRKQQIQQIEWRRCQVMELNSRGYNQSEIARKLQLPKWTICRDIAYLKEQSKKNIRKYIDEILPFEYEKCLVGLKSILKEAWTIKEQSQDTREKIQAISVAEHCIVDISELLTHATIVDEAIKFVSSHKSKRSDMKINEDAGDTNSTYNYEKIESVNTYNEVF